MEKQEIVLGIQVSVRVGFLFFYKSRSGTALEMVRVWFGLKPKNRKTPKPELNLENPKNIWV